MKSKILIKIIIGVLVVAGVAFGYSKYQTAKNSEQKLPEVFQPDSQVLNQAIDGERATANKGDTIPDQPVNAKSGVKYEYKNGICNTATKYGCLVDYYKGLVNDYGVVTASADIEKRSKEDSLVLSDCHPLMHVIGRTAASAYQTTSEAFAHGDSFCWSGYYHGVMEGLIAKIGLKNLPVELNAICADIPGKESYNFNYYNCVHGLGHGIMALLGDEVFQSLKMCDNLTGSWEQQSCYGGVFMQNIIDSTNVADTDNVVKDLRPSEPLYPCTAVEAKYKGQCYLGQTSYALQVTGYNYKKVFDMCTKVEEPYRDICNQSMGRDVANQAGHEKNRTKELCFITPLENDRNNCIVGAVKEIISYYHSDKQANEFCNVLDGQSKSICIATSKSYYSNF